jgi:hypothetical protein
LSVFIDTSIWSLALRRNTPDITPEVAELGSALRSGEPVFTSGLILQELLRGFRGPRARDAIVERFSALPSIHPERADHIAAADLRNDCRRHGIQLGTIDALLAQLCIRFELALLTTDADFGRISQHHPLQLWSR